MAKHYSIWLCLLFISHNYVYATIEQALQDWQSVKVGASVKQTPTYQGGYDLAFQLGSSMSKDEAVTNLKPWAYFRGAQSNQKECNFDTTFNGIIESIQKSITQSAMAGALKGQMSSVIEQNIQGYASSAKAYVSETASSIKKSVASPVNRFTSYIRSWWSGTQKEETQTTP